MTTKLLGIMLLAGSSLFAETHFSIGIGVGGYGYAPPPVVAYAPPVVAYRPPCPGPGYEWTDGYWYQAGPRRLWRAGYWARPYSRGYVVVPRYSESYYENRREWNRYDDGRYDRDRYGYGYSNGNGYYSNGNGYYGNGNGYYGNGYGDQCDRKRR